MKILVLNAGSSSIKYRLFDMRHEQVLAAGAVERIGEAAGRLNHRSAKSEPLNAAIAVSDHRAALSKIMETLARTGDLSNPNELHAIGHRIVHGGERFRTPVHLDGRTLAALAELDVLAPLHNPANRLGVEVAMALAPGVPQVAVFDTAFHLTLPPYAYLYALPYHLNKEFGVRRYGFHGISHAYVTGEAIRLLGRKPADTMLVSLHLGNGASATAVAGGQSIETSMGMTPLEGLVMGTRCGDLDPAVPFYLVSNAGMDYPEVKRMLNTESGLKGICGDNDLREVERRAKAGDPRASLALDMLCHRLKKYIGAYLAVLGRADALVFTGGIGENSARVRAGALTGMEGLGIAVDPKRNEIVSTQARDIASQDSRVRVLVIPTEEELEIARQTLTCVDTD